MHRVWFVCQLVLLLLRSALLPLGIEGNHWLWWARYKGERGGERKEGACVMYAVTVSCYHL